MITTKRIRDLRPGERVVTAHAGNMRAVVERTADGKVRWLREVLDADGTVVETSVLPTRSGSEVAESPPSDASRMTKT